MLRQPLPSNESTFTTNWFRYSPPIEPIERSGFIGTTWGDVDPPPINRLLVRGKEQKIDVFGFQALRGNREMPASIIMHPEKEQTELTYRIKGAMDMTIQTSGEHPVTSHMIGPVPEETDLSSASFCIKENGALVISVNNKDYESFPTITPAGSSHGTIPITDECLYLAVKVSK